MTQRDFKPALLLQQKRSGYVETEHYGFIVHCNADKKISSIGKTNGYPFFHRSCAKPLQASLIDDYETIKHYNLTSEEIAVCCASHAGEKVHIEILKKLLKKGGFNESDMQCPAIAPLNNFENLKNFSKLHNNCSGKHILMLLLCKQNNWDIKTYLDKDHPLQKAVYKKIKDLCEEKEEMHFTLDGRMAPNWATSLVNLAVGFLNLIIQSSDITDAMKAHPYLIGGKDRLDTNLMLLSSDIVAKVGAQGLCTVANTGTRESLVIKLTDTNFKARATIALEILTQLNWINTNSIDSKLLYDFFDYTTYTESGERVGAYSPCFDLNSLKPL